MGEAPPARHTGGESLKRPGACRAPPDGSRSVMRNVLRVPHRMWWGAHSAPHPWTSLDGCARSIAGPGVGGAAVARGSRGTRAPLSRSTNNTYPPLPKWRAPSSKGQHVLHICQQEPPPPPLGGGAGQKPKDAEAAPVSSGATVPLSSSSLAVGCQAFAEWGRGGSGRVPSEEPCGRRWVLLSCP